MINMAGHRGGYLLLDALLDHEVEEEGGDGTRRSRTEIVIRYRSARSVERIRFRREKR